jgi:hypothetical protein
MYLTTSKGAIMAERATTQSGGSEAGAFDLATFKPNPPNYQPSFKLEEQLRQDDRAGGQAADLSGAGTFVDNGWDRWHFMVVPGTPNVLTLQLQVADVITWWKRIEVYANLFGGFWFNIRTLGTSNDTRTATINLTPADAQSGTLRLDFWKAGFLNSGSYVTSQVLDVPSHLGNTVVFLCSRDNPSQP